VGKRQHIYHGPNRVREFRKKRKLTLQKAAPLIGLSWAHLARIEKGERELNTIWMERIGRVLNCTPADLLSPDLGGLSENEREFVKLIRELPELNRRAIEAILESQRQFLPKAEANDLPLFTSVD